jgi:hypothetical protein
MNDTNGSIFVVEGRERWPGKEADLRRVRSSALENVARTLLVAGYDIEIYKDKIVASKGIMEIVTIKTS